MALSLGMLGDHPIYGPAEGSELPGVVILHGSEGPWGGWSHRFAAILAAHGYLAVPHGYGEGDVWNAGNIHEVDLTRVLRTGRDLAAHPRCRSVGLFGWSRGGEATMHIAVLAGPDTPFAAYAAHAPADRVVPAFDAGVLQGRPRALVEGARAWVWPGAEDALAPGSAIEIERCPRPIFLSVGTEDQVWDPDMTRNLARRLTEAGRDPDVFIAEGQGHGFAFDREWELWDRLTAFFGKHLEG